MTVLPSDKILNSNYKGSLPSQKYFTPQELNNLSKVRPDSKTRKREELKKM